MASVMERPILIGDIVSNTLNTMVGEVISVTNHTVTVKCFKNQAGLIIDPPLITVLPVKTIRPYDSPATEDKLERSPYERRVVALKSYMHGTIQAEQARIAQKRSKSAGYIMIEPFSTLNTAAVIMGNNKDLDNCNMLEKSVLTKLPSGITAHVSMPDAVEILCKSLLGKYREEVFSMFLKRMRELQPWAEGNEEILNVFGSFMRSYSKDILFINRKH